MTAKLSNQRVSIREIAAEAGVSTSTVSKVLNGYENFSVRDEVRNKILELVKRRSYSPNPMFRSLRAEKSRQISFLFQGSSPFDVGAVVNQAVEAMSPLLAEQCYQLNYTFYQNNGTDAYYLPPWKVDGIVFTDITRVSVLDSIVEAKTPFVVLNGESGGRGPAVKIDEDIAMAQAVEHLRSLGHSKIVYANGKNYHHYSVAARHDAYMLYMASVGLPLWPGHDEMGANPAAFLLKHVLEDGATALIAYDHLLALHYLHAAWELGISVPKRLSIVAFNDQNPAEIAIPPLTCVASPAAEMGRKTVELLLAQIDSGEPSGGLEIKIPGKLIVRRSTAEPGS